MRRDKGEGSIFQRKDGKWVACLDVSVGLKRRRPKRVRNSKQAAKEALADLKIWAAKRGNMAGSSLTVGAWLMRWLERPGSALRPATRASYAQMVRDHIRPHLEHRRLSDLTPPLLQAWLDELQREGKSAHTVKYARDVLRAALSTAVNLGHLDRNPAERVQVPQTVKRRVTPLQPADLDRMVKVSPRWFACWLMVTVGLGLRRGESLGLQWGDIDFAAASIQIVRQITDRGLEAELKTPQSRRGGAMPEFVLQALKAHSERTFQQELNEERESSPWVFSTVTGNTIRPRNLARLFYAVRKDAKVNPKVRIHDLRHTAATMLLAAGTDHRYIADWLGHADPRTTLGIYTHGTQQSRVTTAATMQKLLGG